MALVLKPEDGLPNISSDEDNHIQVLVQLRDHDFDSAGSKTGKLTSINDYDLVQKYLKLCQVEPVPVQVSWGLFKQYLNVKHDEIQFLSQELIAHRQSVHAKEQTGTFNNLDLKLFYLFLLFKKQTVRRALKSFIRGSHTELQKQLVVARVRMIYAHYDGIDLEIDLYAKLVGIPSPLLSVTRSNMCSLVHDAELFGGGGTTDVKGLTDTLCDHTQLIKEKVNFQLHVDADASKDTYCAVAYTRQSPINPVDVQLCMTQSRFTQLHKKSTLPLFAGALHDSFSESFFLLEGKSIRRSINFAWLGICLDTIFLGSLSLLWLRGCIQLDFRLTLDASYHLLLKITLMWCPGICPWRMTWTPFYFFLVFLGNVPCFLLLGEYFLMKRTFFAWQFLNVDLC